MTTPPTPTIPQDRRSPMEHERDQIVYEPYPGAFDQLLGPDSDPSATPDPATGACHCIGQSGPNPDCGRCGGDGDAAPSTTPATPEAGDLVSRAARPAETAPKDGTLLRLLVDYRGEDGSAPLDDADQAWTIGFNNLADTGDDEWQIAGWSWSHDHFTEGHGVVIGWLPFHDDHTPAAAQGQEGAVSVAQETVAGSGKLTRKQLSILRLILTDHINSEMHSDGAGLKTAQGILRNLTANLAPCDAHPATPAPVEAGPTVAEMIEWHGPGDRPHRYSPDLMAGGDDCRHCGHSYDAHVARAQSAPVGGEVKG